MVTSTKEMVEGDQDDRERRALQDELDVRATVTKLVTDASGRAFLWRLLQLGKWGTQPYAGDPNATAFSCGELNVGQQIFALIVETAPDGFILMLKERKDAGRPDQSAAASALTGAGTSTTPDADPYASTIAGTSGD